MRLALILITVLLLLPPTARAAESPNPTRHAVDYRLDWLNFIAPEDLPPTRYAVCIVDSGLAITPDTPADDPNGPILERLSVDGGSGEPQGTAAEQVHGTRMAMAAVAPVNDWGTVGITTWGRVISVRAMVQGETTLRAHAYRQGIVKCQNATGRHAVAVVSLSLGCSCEISAEEQVQLEDQLTSAHDNGLSVVAAAGNAPGAPTSAPARSPGVFAVAAGAGGGALCDYASFDSRVDLLAPGCPVDAADPRSGDPFSDMAGGSSTATVVTAALIAALRTLRPDASYQQVERWVRDSARSHDGRRVLDGEAAARMAGIGPLVDRARARMPRESPSPTPKSDSDVTATRQPEVAPGISEQSTARPMRYRAPRRVRARWRNGRLSVKVAGRRRGASLQVVAEYLDELGLTRRRVRRMVAADRLTLRLRAAPQRIAVRFVPTREFGGVPSRALRLMRTSSGRFRWLRPADCSHSSSRPLRSRR